MSEHHPEETMAIVASDLGGRGATPNPKVDPYTAHSRSAACYLQSSGIDLSELVHRGVWATERATESSATSASTNDQLVVRGRSSDADQLLREPCRLAVLRLDPQPLTGPVRVA